MRRCLVMTVAALTASPAVAGEHLRVGIEVSWTPDARRPLGVGASVDLSTTASEPATKGGLTGQLMLGGGLRLDVFTDGAIQAGIEPIVGSTAILDERSCFNQYRPLLLGDVRPGVLIRTHGGPALSFAGRLAGGPMPLSLDTRVGAAIALTKDPKRPARVPGLFQDPTLAFGVGLASDLQSGCWVEGRPLRDDGRITLADADDPPLDALAADWLHQAREEHAAVAAFLRLAAELELLGGPTHLVRACQQAAADEAVHARICLERAATHAGRTLHIAPLTTHARDLGPRLLALRTLAL